jgi:hypothetical protein
MQTFTHNYPSVSIGVNCMRTVSCLTTLNVHIRYTYHAGGIRDNPRRPGGGEKGNETAEDRFVQRVLRNQTDWRELHENSLMSNDIRRSHSLHVYLIKSGCQWDMIPKDYPKKGIVWHYYKIWSTPRPDGSTMLTAVLKKNSGNGAKR